VWRISLLATDEGRWYRPALQAKMCAPMVPVEESAIRSLDPLFLPFPLAQKLQVQETKATSRTESVPSLRKLTTAGE